MFRTAGAAQGERRMNRIQDYFETQEPLTVAKIKRYFIKKKCVTAVWGFFRSWSSRSSAYSDTDANSCNAISEPLHKVHSETNLGFTVDTHDKGGDWN